MDRPSEFSLVEGGPFYGLCRRCGLIRPPVRGAGRRIAALFLITWLPLLLLSAAAGMLLEGATVPFLHDIGVHARFLGSLPLLIIAEVLVHDRISKIARQFLDQGVVPPQSRARFEEAIASSRRLMTSVVPEAILALLAVTAGYWLWSAGVALPVDTWYGREGEGRREFTPAGAWYAFVSLPIVRFLLYRWYFRLAVWYRFLWRVSRLPLNLNALHPDRAAGLGFLGGSVIAFAPLLVAHTVLLAGLIGDRLLHQGATLTQFKIEIGTIAGALLLLVHAPLALFAGPLSRARRTALREYGLTAARYVDDFRDKWIRSSPASPLGTPDIQSLADLSSSFDVVRETRPLPFSKRSTVILLGLIAAPLLPLVLTLIPLEELVGRLMKLVV